MYQSRINLEIVDPPKINRNDNTDLSVCKGCFQAVDKFGFPATFALEFYSTKDKIVSSVFDKIINIIIVLQHREGEKKRSCGTRTSYG